jgi:hypothetical protein
MTCEKYREMSRNNYQAVMIEELERCLLTVPPDTRPEVIAMFREIHLKTTNLFIEISKSVCGSPQQSDLNDEIYRMTEHFESYAYVIWGDSIPEPIADTIF